MRSGGWLRLAMTSRSTSRLAPVAELVMGDGRTVMTLAVSPHHAGLAG